MHPDVVRHLVRDRRQQLMAAAAAQRLRSSARHVRESEAAAALILRPIECDDADRIRGLFSRLSPESVLHRFFSPIRSLSPAQVERLVTVDHDARDALVAVNGDEIVAVARYDALAGTRDAELALTVDDAWQGHGVGRRLTRALTALAAGRGFEHFVATVMPDNRGALALVRAVAPDASIQCDRHGCDVLIPLAR